MKKHGIFVICLFLFCLNSLLAEKLERASYLSNKYFSPIVNEMERAIQKNENVRNVLIYEADDPFPFIPDMFFIQIELKSGDVVFVRGIKRDLNFHKKWGGIDRINNIDFVCADGKNFSMYAPYQYLSQLFNEKFNLNDFLDSFNEFSQILYSLPEYLGSKQHSNDDVNARKSNFYLYRWTNGGFDRT